MIQEKPAARANALGPLSGTPELWMCMAEYSSVNITKHRSTSSISQSVLREKYDGPLELLYKYYNNVYLKNEGLVWPF